MPETSTNLRDFLDHREKELVAEIANKRAQLIPLEAELAQVRQAKRLIGPSAEEAQQRVTKQLKEVEAAAQKRLSEAVEAIQHAFAAARAQGEGDLSDVELDFLQDAVPAALGEIDPSSAGGAQLLSAARRAPYGSYTMKQLVVAALEDHFRNGATTRKLIDFFRDAWGCNIERTSLSPQLSRLYQDGVIGRAVGYKEWHLMHRGDVIDGFKGFVQRHNKEVVYMLPEQARLDDDSPILTATNPAPEPDED